MKHFLQFDMYASVVCNLNSPAWFMWYISPESWPCHNTATQLSGYGLSPLSVHLWTNTGYLCWDLLTHTWPRQYNERIVILESLQWLSLNMCVLKCILCHTPVSRCCWMDKWCQNSVRKLSFLEFMRVWGFKVCADIRMACVAKIIRLLHDRTK